MTTQRTFSLLALLAGVLLASAALADAPPTVSPPANNRGSGLVMPNITLPSGWANPNTGGSGGQVSPPVDVSSGTVHGSAVNTSSGTAKSK
jgi:hypothetical protein